MSHEVAAMAAADRSDIAALTGAVRGLIGEMRRARREAGTLAPQLQPLAASAASDIAATAETVAAKIRAASQPQLEQEHPGMDDAAAQTFTGPSGAEAEHDASSFVDEGAGDPIGLSPSETLALAEEYRLLALAELDHLSAAVSTAVAALRWSGGSAQRIADTLTLASHHLAEALDFESARVRLLTGEPQPEPAPAEHQAAAAPAPAPAFPPESYLVAATRSLEAVKSHADQALMGLQFAPHEHGILIDVMQGLRQHAEAGARAHLHYAGAQVAAS